jgi:hypothetical protein
VAELFNQQGTGWNGDKLQQLFHDFDVNDIKKIPIGGVGTQDYYAWNFTKNGVFTVRSAYHLCMELIKMDGGLLETSTSMEAHKGCSLGCSPVPSKVKIDVWRLLKNVLLWELSFNIGK